MGSSSADHAVRAPVSEWSVNSFVSLSLFFFTVNESLWERCDDVHTHDYVTRVLLVVPRDSCALLNERKKGSAHTSHLADIAYGLLSEHRLEELLSLDLVMLAVPFAGQY